MTPTSKIAESRRKSGVRWTPLVAAWKSPMRGSVHRAVAGSRIHYLLWAREPAAPGERRRDRQFADSPLEGDGFELVVPRCVVGGRLADDIAESAASGRLRRALAPRPPPGSQRQ